LLKLLAMFTVYKEEIQHLIKNIESLKQTLGQQEAEIKQIRKQNIELEIIIKEKELIIEDIEFKYKSLLNAREISHKLEGNDNAKAKINTLVREIDKCIALLND